MKNLTAEQIRGLPLLPQFMPIAEKIVNSNGPLGTYAACEWDELHSDGQLWIAAIVREAMAVAAEMEA